MVLLVLGIQKFAGLYNYQKIPTAEVKSGMILSAENVMQFQQSRVRFLPSDPSEEITARISEEEADAVHRWKSSATGEPYIWIVRKIPFGIMIFTGVALWIAIRLWG